MQNAKPKRKTQNAKSKRKTQNAKRKTQNATFPINSNAPYSCTNSNFITFYFVQL